MSTEASAEAGAKAGPAEAYNEKSPINNGVTAAIQAGALGFFVSAVQNSLGTHKHGAMGIFTRTGSSIGICAAIGAAYGLTESFVSNMRHKDDAVNGAVGACASGFVIGASTGSVPTMFGSCAGLAALIGTFGAAGRSLAGPYKASLVDAARGENPESGDAGRRSESERRRKSFFKEKKPVEEQE